MSRKLSCLLLCLALVLSGCIYRSGASERPAVVVYRLSLEDTGGRLVRETVSLAEGQEPLPAMIEALNGSASVVGMASALPENVEISSWSLAGGTAAVELSREYLTLTDTERLLAESAIVLSLGTVDEVCRVNIRCGGNSLGIGLIPEMYAEADGLCGVYKRTVKLYLPDGGVLVPKSADVPDDGRLGNGEMVLAALLPAIGGGMENTDILSVETENGLCSVELSGEFFGAEPTEKSEGMLIIYSIVNSLCRLPGVDAVSVNVEGAELESYGGFRCVWPLGPNNNIISH